ncbi:hypothetical protein ABW19_dt0207771 [Dactylella cylindrospora]|nr:hypothetical protein ABW19_dt0207771 [Dactylella cylindrospora]
MPNIIQLFRKRSTSRPLIRLNLRNIPKHVKQPLLRLHRRSRKYNPQLRTSSIQRTRGNKLKFILRAGSEVFIRGPEGYTRFMEVFEEREGVVHRFFQIVLNVRQCKVPTAAFVMGGQPG